MLAAIITFATTYALILPAITVERNRTDEIGGMYLEQEEDRDDMFLENALDPAEADILAGGVDDEVGAGEAWVDAEIPDYDAALEENAQADSADEVAPAMKTLRTGGSDYTVTLTCDETSGLPEDAELVASEIAQDSEEYQTYLEETKKAMGLAEEEALPDFAARFFDIKIMAGDEEFKPEYGVSVEITYAEPLADKPFSEVNAIHFADEAAEMIEANTSEIQEDGTATVEFVAESFSVYGIIYTVDFHWEENVVGESGETWEIVVTYGEDAEIPAGASLSVREIVKRESEDGTDTEEAGDEYAEYLT